MTLTEGLRDMIAGGRLSAATIPDDFDWLVATLDGPVAEIRALIDDALSSPAVLIGPTAEAECALLQAIRERLFGAKLIVDEAATDAAP